MNKPRSLLASTWSAAHLAKLRAAAAEVLPEKADAFAADLPFIFAHVESATFNADHGRIEVRLHGGGIAFHVPVKVEEKFEGKVAAGEASVTVGA